MELAFDHFLCFAIPRRKQKFLEDIAIRVFCAAKELVKLTVAIYSAEDQNLQHRTKADKSFLIGERLTLLVYTAPFPTLSELLLTTKSMIFTPGARYNSVAGACHQPCALR